MLFYQNHLKSGQKCSESEWSGLQQVGTLAIAKGIQNPLKTGPFEIHSSKCLNLEWLDFKSILYLDVERPSLKFEFFTT